MNLRMITTSLVAAGFAACIAPVLGTADSDSAPAFVTTIPPGYRD
jgi:hypothetical protein